MVSFGLMLASSTALAQGTGGNVVRQATDAFGLRIGTETIGLYNQNSVRGFNPAVANNLRLNGLYLRRTGQLTDRVVDSTTIQVGLNTVGQLFPAPSGIADFRLRPMAERDTVRVATGFNPYVSPFVEVDANLVSQDRRWGLVAGLAAVGDNNHARGGDNVIVNAGLIPRWAPNERVTLTGYFDIENSHDREVPSTLRPAGAYLPPRADPRTFHGQEWADHNHADRNMGLLVDVDPEGGWQFRAGLFDSRHVSRKFAFGAVRNVRPDGMGDLFFLLSPGQRFEAVSGDVQATYAWEMDELRQSLTLVARGHRFDSVTGGEVEVPLGPWSIFQPRPIAEPAVTFTNPPDLTRVDQTMAGLSWRLQWGGRLDLKVGAQKANYEKTVRPGRGGIDTSGARPWLYNAIGAWRFSPELVAYASYSRGLEETGSAPFAATNRGEVLPAAETTQRELGLRTALGPLTLTSSFFDIRRPQPGFQLDGSFGLIGTVTHRGIEASLSGRPVEELSVVVGGILMDPVVDGPDVRAGLRGKRPVAQSKAQAQANLDYSLPFLERTSVDLAVNYRSAVTARGDNLVDVPPYTFVDVGARHSFSLFGREATLRFQVTNVFDAHGYVVFSANEYIARNARTWRLRLSTSF